MKFWVMHIEKLEKYNGLRIDYPDYCDIPFDKVDNGYVSFDSLLGHDISNQNYDISVMNEELFDGLSESPRV